MKRQVSTTIILGFITLAVSCTSNTPKNKESELNKVHNNTLINNFKEIDWLLGNWTSEFPEGYVIESWEKKNDLTFKGISNVIMGGDTVSSEAITIKNEEFQTVCIPIVKNQNGSKPIKFTLTSFKDNHLVFENPEHDFPQKIVYKKITKDSLLVEISGEMNGTINTQTLPMTRIKTSSL